MKDPFENIGVTDSLLNCESKTASAGGLSAARASRDAVPNPRQVIRGIRGESFSTPPYIQQGKSPFFGAHRLFIYVISISR